MGLTVLGILAGMYAVYQLAAFTYNLTYAFWMNHYAAFDTEDNNDLYGAAMQATAELYGDLNALAPI
jgi:hemolysin activation/secretion protein